MKQLLWNASRLLAREAQRAAAASACSQASNRSSRVAAALSQRSAGELLTFTRLYAAAGKKGKGAKSGAKGVKEELVPFLPLILKPEALNDKPQKMNNKQRFTKEELAEAAKRSKAYSRNKNKQHLEWRRDMEAKFKCKNEAFEALPKVLQGPANVPDLEPFPMTRRIPTDYPPSTWPL